MKNRKETSTSSINETFWNKNCGVYNTMSMIAGKWKINILCYLLNDKKLRYTELKERLTGVSEKMLASKLKELESHGLIRRIVYPQVPPKVVYEITEFGSTLEPIIALMDQWGNNNISANPRVSGNNLVIENV